MIGSFVLLTIIGTLVVAVCMLDDFGLDIPS